MRVDNFGNDMLFDYLNTYNYIKGIHFVIRTFVDVIYLFLFSVFRRRNELLNIYLFKFIFGGSFFCF